MLPVNKTSRILTRLITTFIVYLPYFLDNQLAYIVLTMFSSRNYRLELCWVDGVVGFTSIRLFMWH